MVLSDYCQYLVFCVVCSDNTITGGKATQRHDYSGITTDNKDISNYVFFLDLSEGDEIAEVHSYTLSTGDYTSNYFLAYQNNLLIYWGYPHEFARSKDPLLNEIGRKAARKLKNLESN